jgi:aspartate racemase
MIELTAKEISKQKLPSNKVGILASPAVEITRLFDDALSSYKIEALYPSKQSQMLKVIRSIKENNKGNGVCEIINSAATELNEKGADIILIACSELSLVLDCLQSSYVVIDSMDVLSKAVINFSNNGRQFNLK